MSKLFLSLLAICLSPHSCEGNIINEDVEALSIREGIVSQKAQKIKFKTSDRKKIVVQLSKPVTVVQAEQDESWGFFQFPTIARTDSGTLVVYWQMQDDSYKSYGRKTNRTYTPMMSKDGGMTWVPQDRWYTGRRRDYGVCEFNGKLLQVITPRAKDIKTYKTFPNPVEINGRRSYYRMEAVPEEFQGPYVNIRGEGIPTKTIHAKLYDPGLLRYTTDGFMPVVWWGNIRHLSDQSLVAGIHPCYYLDSLGHVTRSSVSFYRSEDDGKSWSVIGKIPFRFDGIADKRGDRMYDEPTYEILADSTFICVMRTGNTSPMYKTYSYDRGRSWSIPVPFTPNGVKPNLMLLKNGVLVLISGRPGVQLRFSFDGTGKKWSEPIDMIPFMNSDGTYTRDVSCGYASFVDDSDNSFYLVYSDFTTKNAKGEIRKSIMCRKVTVTTHE